jgi:hypothetical protein
MTMLTVARGATRRAMFSWALRASGLLLIEFEGCQDTGIGMLKDCCGEGFEEAHGK